MRFFTATLLLATVLATGSAQAADDPWNGEVALGYLRTSGNSDTQSLNGKAELKHDAEPLHQRFHVSATNTSDSGEQTGERYAAGYKLDYDFSEKNYLFFSWDYERDLFGGIDRRGVAAVGYGRRLLESATHELDVELGAGFRQQRDAAGDETDDAIARLSGDYRWQITDNNRFKQTLRVESGDTNTFTESVSDLKLTIVGNLYAGIAYTLRNNSDVPAGTEKTDTETLINFGYTFSY